jgi:hypothetical protein
LNHFFFATAKKKEMATGADELTAWLVTIAINAGKELTQSEVDAIDGIVTGATANRDMLVHIQDILATICQATNSPPKWACCEQQHTYVDS